MNDNAQLQRIVELVVEAMDAVAHPLTGLADPADAAAVLALSLPEELLRPALALALPGLIVGFYELRDAALPPLDHTTN